MPQVVVVADMAGIVRGANAEASRLFARSHEELVGAAVATLVPERYAQHLDRFLRQFAVAPERRLLDRNEEIAVLRRDGTEIPVQFGLAPLQAGGALHVVATMIDLTERKRAEQALRVSEEKFSRVFRASPDAISVSDEETGVIFDINDGFERLLAYTRAETVGRSALELGVWAEPADRARLVETLRSQGTVRDFQTCFHRKNGERRTFLLAAEPVQILGRNCIVLVSRDIEQRVRRERSLRESEERFSKAFLGSSDAIAISKFGTGIVIEVNASFERFFGQARKDVLGRTVAELGLWQDPEQNLRLVETLLAEGSVRDCVMQTRRSDGSLRPCLLSADRIEIAGRPCVVMIMRDITERVLVEQALRESEEKFSKAFRASPDAMTVAELDTGRYIEINDGFERLFHCRREEIIGRSAVELGLWDDPAMPVRLRAELQRLGSVRDFEVSAHTRDGTALTCRLHAESVELGGRPCFVAALHDITESRRAEEAKAVLEHQLRQAQKLEALGQLAGGIAHDFNNILTPILAYTELALEDAERPGDVRAHLGHVCDAGLRARDLVRQILTFSRRQKQERRPARLQTVIQEAITLLRSTLPASIEIELKVDASTPVVLAEPSQIHQVIMNLATNAAHAMRQRPGRLTVALDEQLIEATAARTMPDLHPGRHVRLAISDTGHGMDAATLRRIFEPFFTTKGPGEGTGLGLAVVHGIVKDHEGAVTVESAPGEGTTFTLYFPVAGAAPALPPAPRAAAAGGSGQHVLFVDDEVVICELARTTLTRAGYHVTAHSDPVAALQQFREFPSAFDVVITDMSMPRLTGLMLTEEILNIRPEIPVLLATGYSGEWTSEGVRQLGIRELLGKPLSHEELAAAVRRAIDATAEMEVAGETGAGAFDPVD